MPLTGEAIRVYKVFSYRYEEEKFSLQLVLAVVWYKLTFSTTLGYEPTFETRTLSVGEFALHGV